MQELGFLQDFAAVMLVAGLVTLLFHRLKQPVVLGYLLAGFIIGPFTPPFPLVRDIATIRTMADLGVIVLMFSLGLEFNLRKLQAVGRPALVVAVIEISIMLLVGYELGHLLGWKPADRVLLGIMLALTSTTIVVKSLRDRGELDQPHGHLISGVSIYDDIFVILVMVMLPGFARSGSLPTGQVLLTLAGLFVFLVAGIVVGLLLVPRLVRFVSRLHSDEMLLVLSLGLCFGMALLAVQLQFSAALGAFLMGGILAATSESGRIATLTAPIRDMFSAVFFVSIGMLIDPRQVLAHGGTVLIIAGVYLVAKVGASALGALAAGYSGQGALRVGTGMAQIGEFAFMLAVIAASLGLSSDFLSPVIVSVATVNALLRPYLVDNADRLSAVLARWLPDSVRAGAGIYARWLKETGAAPRTSPAHRIIRSVIWQIALNLALIAGAFVIAAFAARLLPQELSPIPKSWGGMASLCWLAALVICLPLYVVTFRKIQATAMMLAEVTVHDTGPRSKTARTLVMHTLLALGNGGVLLLTLALSAPLLPPTRMLLLLLIVVGLLLLRYGTAMNRWYSRAKFSLVEAWNQPQTATAPAAPPGVLREAEMKPVTVPEGPVAGRQIRELDLRARTGASIIAIERGGRRSVSPSPDERLAAGDQLLLLGSPEQLAKAERLLAPPVHG